MERVKTLLYFPLVGYLSFFARLTLRIRKQTVIAVTGSTGKSSMVGLIRILLDEAHYQYEFADHTNSALGIPLYLLGFPGTDVNNAGIKYLRWITFILLAPLTPLTLLIQKRRFAPFLLFEQDSDRPGEMRHSAKLLQSDYVIWLNAAITHSEYHDKAFLEGRISSIEDSIANEFAEGIRSMKKSGLAILNADDEAVYKRRKQARGNTIYAGKNGKFVSLVGYSIEGLQSIFDIQVNIGQIQTDLWMYNLQEQFLKSWGTTVHLEIQGYLLPQYYYYTFASAILFSIAMNIPYGTFMQAMRKFTLPPGRMSIFEGINSSYIIDSSYNASRTATEGAIELLGTYEHSVAILADMRELGNEAKEEHEKIAQKLIDCRIGTIILVGPSMMKYADRYLKEKNIPNSYAYETTKELKNDLIKQRFKQIPQHSMILVKGSQNTLFLESIVELLLKNKEYTRMLCRRGMIWDERRAAIGL